MARRLETIIEVNRRIRELCENFECYLKIFESERKSATSDSKPIFSHGTHIRTINLRNTLGSVSNAINSDEFLKLLWNTLEDWGMNSRGAALQFNPEFTSRLRSHSESIQKFEELTCRNLEDTELVDDLWTIIRKLNLSRTNSQLITGSKALHHLLPQSIPPIDGNYTARFFHYQGSRLSGEAKSVFKFILKGFAQIARCLESRGYDLSAHVNESKVATSESKLIDNAIVGYVKKHNL